MKTIVNITGPDAESGAPLFNLGFRPFFLMAGFTAIGLIVAWYLIYAQHIQLPSTTVNLHQWHAHEMIYGYCMAVVAGFLLTATKNWTGLQTLSGIKLFRLAAFWLVARLLFTVGLILPAAVFDLLFCAFLIVSVTVPMVQSKRYQQLVVVSKLVFMFVFNLCFYLGALNLMDSGLYVGIYGGFYLIIGLTLMFGRRVVPFFIERGVEEAVNIKHSKTVDLSSMVFFLIFFVAELTQIHPKVAAFSALFVAVITGYRLVSWYTPGIWKKPLLWSLYLALWCISIGFLLIFLTYAIGLPLYAVLHMFAYGGIGLITLSMMSRVSLGHTGRDIHQPPAGMHWAFVLLLIGTLLRVVLCATLPGYYMYWLVGAMMCWVAAFAMFSYHYYAILMTKRVDGQFG